jgi:transcriptional regulator with XRE-family HTH domain
MTSDEVIKKVRDAENRPALARATGLSYNYLSRLAQGLIKEPGASKIDVLRDYFERSERKRVAPRGEGRAA